MERGFAQGRGYTADQESLPLASLLKWQVAYTAKEGKMIAKKKVDSINNMEEFLSSLHTLGSSSLDSLARAVLREVLRRGIKDREISPRVYIAAELLLLKEESNGNNDE